MAGIKLEGFEGLVPRTSSRLLRGMAATIAENTKLLSGELRGFRAPREEAIFTDEYFTVRRAFRVPDQDANYTDEWLLFDNRNVDVVRSPLINDAHDRYYYTGGGERPQMTSYHRILNGLPGLYLGIPRPTVAPTVTPPAGGDSTRAYVYTFVSEFGEEGPPSDPTLTTGTTGEWLVSTMLTTVPDSANRSITKKNIYRTVPGNDSSLFFFVEQIDLGTAAYVDKKTDPEVAANSVMESTSFFEPPSDLEGFISMPNGYLVGWVGRRLVFSEPYRPHAWPPEYELSTEFPIVGAVVWGSALIIGTQSKPYFGQGINPASFSMDKMDAVEPCLSKRGMVATVAGAYYPSINGLVLANAGGVQVITQDILTKEEWARYNPAALYAAQLGLQYIAFYNDGTGIIFNPTEPTSKFVEIGGFTDVQGIETDSYSGNVLLLAQQRAWNWDPEDVERLPWRWQSKVYQTPKPVNFGAIRFQFDTADYDVTADTTEYYGTYNTDLLAAVTAQSGAKATLGTLCGTVLCGFPAQASSLVIGWTEPEIKQPLGGDLLYDLAALSVQFPNIRMILYAWDKEGTRFVVMDKTITSERIIRPPTGFKSDRWQVQLIGNTNLYSIQIAETVKELATL